MSEILMSSTELDYWKARMEAAKQERELLQLQQESLNEAYRNLDPNDPDAGTKARLITQQSELLRHIIDGLGHIAWAGERVGI